jgi:hypothetical protein
VYSLPKVFSIKLTNLVLNACKGVPMTDVIVLTDMCASIPGSVLESLHVHTIACMVAGKASRGRVKVADVYIAPGMTDLCYYPVEN